MATATIKMFLAHADPKRLRTAEISNWTGKAIAGPRAEMEDILAREEAYKPGVYFLTGTEPDTGKDAVYIGEAEVVRERIKNHLDKEFWNAIVFVISKDENLTKAHIRYLEGRLIAQAISAGRASVLNSNSSGSKLPESDREDMEVFLDRIHQLIPVLGADFLVPIAAPSEETKKYAPILAENPRKTAEKRSLPRTRDRDKAQNYRGFLHFVPPEWARTPRTLRLSCVN